MNPSPPAIIPFYGAKDRGLFAIERRCMDRDGVVITALDNLLPDGDVLDTGAGDGFTAERLTRARRRIVPVEPAPGMIDLTRSLPWVQGGAQHLPFRDGSFTAAYATWAYFFPGMGHGDAGLAEWHRVVRPGGPLVMVDNAGQDEFSRLDPESERVASDHEWWQARGFEQRIVESVFRFDTTEEARTLLGFYFGDYGREGAKIEVQYRVALYVGMSSGGA